MSGFEIAGIVLAVLPVVAQAGKAHVATLRKAASRATRDDKLEEFYREFWWETFELGKLLEQVVQGLPGISEGRKQDLIVSSDDGKTWAATDIADALNEFFASSDDHLAFQKVMEKVLDLLSRLVKDETIHVSQDEKHHAKMYKLMEDFEKCRIDGSTASTFRDRFKFFRKEKSRSVCLVNLRTWRERLGSIVVRALRKTEDRKKAMSATPGPKGPSPKLRTLSQRLFTALWECWSCDCQDRHEARFCLASCGNADKDPGDSGIHFDFLVDYPHGQAERRWREATVVIKAASSTDTQVRAELAKFCECVQSRQGGGFCAQLLVEDLESSRRIWRLNLREPQLTYLETKPAITFEGFLENYSAPSLIERRRLALTFAYSLFQLHESPWLSHHWNKDSIHFFYQSTSIIDIGRPYLRATFDDFPSGGELPDLDRFHRHLGILRLGILLVELHKWKALESFHQDDDLIEGQPTPNTDMLVLKKLLGSLDDCFPTYRGAIESCLNMPWVSSSSRVSLEDSDTWNGVCVDVIEPLKREVALGTMVV